MTRPGTKPCPVCCGEDTTPVLEMEGMPVFANVLWPSMDEAQAAPRGAIHLVHCPACNHLFNWAFDPTLTEYSPSYENSLHHSGVFTEYITGLAHDLMERYDLRHRDIVELGCGGGEFLRSLCELGPNRGVGFDQSLRKDSEVLKGEGSVRFVKQFLTPETPPLPVDFLCCRHVLEHVAEPLPFLQGVRQWVGNGGDTAFYFEVPNALWTLERGGIWDLIYEHPSYFTEESLVAALRSGGFSPEVWGEAFGGQYLYVMGRSCSRQRPQVQAPILDAARMRTSVHALRTHFEEEIGKWRQRMADEKSANRTMALWGGGSKGVSFLNLLDPGQTVSCVVDINPRKQGRFVAGTGHPILSPEEMASLAPDTVLVTNPLYLDEITTALRRLGVGALVEAVGEGPNES